MGQGLRDELIKQRFYIIKVFLKKKKTDTEILPLMAKYRIYMSVLLFQGGIKTSVKSPALNFYSMYTTIAECFELCYRVRKYIQSNSTNIHLSQIRKFDVKLLSFCTLAKESSFGCIFLLCVGIYKIYMYIYTYS